MMNKGLQLKTNSVGNLLLTGLMASSCISSSSDQKHAEVKQKPNVVVFYVDDLGWSDLPSSGNDYHESPVIDSLRGQSVDFINAYSNCTVSSPSRASLLTGKYPSTTNITDWIPGHKFKYAKMDIPDWQQFLPLEETTMADKLRSCGYVTASYGKWHLGEEEDYYPEHQGFDINFGGNSKGHPKSYFSPYHNPQIPDGPEGEYLTDRLAREASSFIESHQDTSFFLYMPFYQVHTPLKAKKELEEYFENKKSESSRWQNATYAAMVKSTDEAIGHVMKMLDSLNLTENTLVFFASDNGGLTHTIKGDTITSNYPLREGKGSMYEGGVKVPMFMYWKGHFSQARKVSEPVMGMDIFPTVLEAIGEANDLEMDGLSLLPLAEGKDIDRDAIYFHYPHYHPGGAVPYSSMRQGDFKLIHIIEENRYELYNLNKDIGESTNLAESHQGTVEEMIRKLEGWKESTQAQMPQINSEFAPEKSKHPYYRSRINM
ncbi:sulfatase [Aureibacter tunicatorum]|uniref:Arylsulfatase A-like enzyme n=1 Tax=Aureibacter tunicatorum TaxID=866807 RepID=A0AAE3XTV0_9BACT|nr:sulfatase [Aureibacter tunicatorum]MDR6241771.1 arylsulfatase A-like enzyme [Aureibacter tunicatorum]BDD07437.1 sulfatase [Aureibacter tunicatorum]